MEIFGAGGTQGPQPIYPRLSAFSVDAGQTVHAGARAIMWRSLRSGRCLTALASCRKSATRRWKRSVARSQPEVTKHLKSWNSRWIGCWTR